VTGAVTSGLPTYGVDLRDPADLASGEAPRVSLLVTARGQADLGELLGAVRPHFDEVVVLDVGDRGSDPSAGDADDVVRGALDLAPDLCFPDTAETYRAGRPLDGEVPSWTCTGRSLVADWAAVKNQGWRRCSGEFRLHLDDDEVLSNPEYARSVCLALWQRKSDVALTEHSEPSCGPAGFTRTSSIVPRVGSASPSVYFDGAVAPRLEGGLQISILPGLLAVRRTRVRPDEDVVVLKTAYARARRLNWGVPPSELLVMARRSAWLGGRRFAEAAVSRYLDLSLYTEERAWACCIMGEVLEEAGDLEAAASWYGRGVAEHPGWKAPARLCRVMHQLGRHEACLAAHREVMDNVDHVHVVDDGPDDREALLMLVSASLHALGRRAEASEVLRAVREAHPESAAVARLCEALGVGA
jgi:hypothetical protein